MSSWISARLASTARRFRVGVEGYRVRMDLEDQIRHRVRRLQVPPAGGVVLRARQIADRAVRIAEREGRRGERRPRPDLEARLEEHLGVQPDEHDLTDPDRLHEEIAGGALAPGGFHQELRPVLALLGDPDLPLLRIAGAALVEGAPSGGEKALGIVERRQVDVVERDRGLGCGEVGAGGALEPAPRG